MYRIDILPGTEPPDIQSDLKEITNFKMMWYDDWYDGPLTGIGNINGELFYYFAYDYYHSIHNNSNRLIYAVIKLNTIELQRCLDWQNLYEVLVGTVNRFDGPILRHEDKFYTELYHAFEKKYRKIIGLPESRIIGWFIG
jgi:hypothetical protein